MRESLRYRLHEWLADHIKWVQYPGVSTNRPFFRHEMPWETRVLIGLFSLVLVLFGGALLAAFLFVGWALIR